MRYGKKKLGWFMQVDLKTLSNNFTVPHPIIFFSVLKWNSTERELLHKRRLWLDIGA